MNELKRKQLIEMNDELMKNCEAYKGAWERCINQMKEDEKEKDNFCKNMVLKIIDDWDFETDMNFIYPLLKLIASYWRK